MMSLFKSIYNRRFGRELISYFDRVYCINLDTRADRWKYVSNHFSRFGMKDKVFRFPAIDVRQDPSLREHEKLVMDNFSVLGMCGCMLSHRGVIEAAKSSGLRNVLVFEDDVKIIEDNISNIGRSLKSLSEHEWDVFYLGATYSWPIEKVNSYLVRVNEGAFATHAIAYNHTVFDKLLGILPSTPLEYLKMDRFKVNAIDKYLKSGLANKTHG